MRIGGGDWEVDCRRDLAVRDRVVAGILAALAWSVGNAVRLGGGRRNCCSDIDFALRDRRMQFFFKIPWLLYTCEAQVRVALPPGEIE